VFAGSASKQEQVQEVIVVFGPLFVFVQLMPVAYFVRLVTNDLVKKHSVVDKATGFNRIQIHFRFPLEEFNCVLEYTVS
jgi:hypothetical protein